MKGGNDMSDNSNEYNTLFWNLSKCLTLFGGIPGIMILPLGFMTYFEEWFQNILDFKSVLGIAIELCVCIPASALISIGFGWYIRTDLITNKALAVFGVAWGVVSWIAIMTLLIYLSCWGEVVILVVSFMVLEIFMVLKLENLFYR